MADIRNQKTMDYDEEGKTLLAALNVHINAATADGRRLYRDLDPIYRHASGGCVYVGNLKAAKSKTILDEHKITCIVNCQGEESKNYFEGVPGMKYFRFVIAYWLSVPGIREDAGVRKFLKGVFHFIDANIANGENMHVTDMDLLHAIAAAKQCRPAINPIGHLVGFLEMFDSLKRRGLHAISTIGPETVHSA